MRRTLGIRLLSALAFALALAVPTLGAVPGAAFASAGDYTVDELSTEVAVETNAAAHVIERQVVTFDTRNSGYIWYLHVPEDGEAVRIASIRVAPVDDGGTVIGSWTRLQMVDVRPVLQGREPGDAAALSVRTARTQPWYSYSIGDGMVRCWFPAGADSHADAESEAKSSQAEGAADGAEGEAEGAGDVGGKAEGAEDAGGTGDAGGAGGEAEGTGGTGGTGSSKDPENAENAEGNADPAASTASANAAGTATRYVIEADYTISHRVRVYRDVGELYWRYANSSLPVDAHDANLQVTLPVPAEALPVEPGVDVMAWGHGPDGGTLEIGADGTVTCHVDVVERGNYAEAHVIFPSWWLGNIADGAGAGANVFTEQRQAAAVAEEAQWVDASMRGETWDFKVRVLFMAIALVVILGGVAVVARHGRSARSRRALVRVAATLAIVALGAQLFFREPVTCALLAAFAAIVALASLMLPATDDSAEA